MKLKRYVYASFNFEGFHCWPDAPEEVDFLRHRHRHLFHVKAVLEVQHNDRDVEFILLKRRLRASVATFQAMASDVETWSCERWAEELLKEHGLSMVDVSEDGENGAIVHVAGYTGPMQPKGSGRLMPDRSEA